MAVMSRGGDFWRSLIILILFAILAILIMLIFRVYLGTRQPHLHFLLS